MPAGRAAAESYRLPLLCTLTLKPQALFSLVPRFSDLQSNHLCGLALFDSGKHVQSHGQQTKERQRQTDTGPICQGT